jgi:OmpA-OmpF porin, OOP family
MKFTTILVLLALCCTGTASAQLFPTQKAKEDLIEKLPFNKKMKVAEGLYRDGSFHNAETYFAQLKKEQPRNPQVTMMLAECQIQLRDYPAAAQNLRNAYELAPGLYPNGPYREALMLKCNGDYVEAKERLNFFLANYKGRDKKMKVYAKRQIEGCDAAIASFANPDPAYVKNAGPNVNTAYTESSPLPLSDTALVFSTMYSNNIIENNKANRKDYVSRLMWSPKEFDRTKIKDTFEVAMPFMDGRYNDPKFHVNNGSWSTGKERFYYTKCLEQDSFQIKCKIFVAPFDTLRGIWGIPKEVDQYINDEESNNTTPMYATIGKKEVLFFSSNRKGQGAGGYDIWYSVYDPKNRTYRRPQNCGKTINTNRDETTPWYDSKKSTLYFSSNGLVSFGGYDIFSAKGGPSRFTNIKNLGAPFNSSADDMYYIEDDSKKGNAYLVSNRLGTIYVKNPTCCDDIWRVIKDPNLSVYGRVIDEATGEVLGQSVVKLRDENSNALSDTFFSKTGNYFFYTPMGKNFSISADHEGYGSGSASISTVGKTAADPDDSLIVDIYMRKIVKDLEIFHVQNVYYNFDLHEFQPGSILALDSLAGFMRDNAGLSVEVVSNTDGLGTDKYNDELSVRRATEVINYLEGKGIDRARMVARPQGERNKKMKENGGRNDEEARQYNRRTEFRVIGDANKRIMYDDNRPEYIDKSGRGAREKNLEVTENEEADQGTVPAETQPIK